MEGRVWVAPTVVVPTGLVSVLRVMLRFCKKPGFRARFNSGLPNSRPLSKYMPYPARIEVRPLPKGSHAIPTRGAMARLNSFPTLLPNGDFVPVKPLNVGGFAYIKPFSGV